MRSKAPLLQAFLAYALLGLFYVASLLHTFSPRDGLW